MISEKLKYKYNVMYKFCKFKI